jgi:hypothetical protein
MSIFKEASKNKLRFETKVGVLSTEQLWDLSIEDLDSLAIDLSNLLEETTKSFLKKQRSKEGSLNQLRFDIVKEILGDKEEYIETSQKAYQKKKDNAVILELIAGKKAYELGNKSLEELESMLQE